MGRFVLGRLAGAAAVLLVMSFVVYGLIGLMPGDPVDLMVSGDPHLTSEDAARLKALYGLDRPLPERWLTWLGDAAQGRFGYSRTYNRPVLEVLAPRLGNSLLLMGSGFLLACALGLPAGILAAASRRRWADAAVSAASFAGIAVPPFWLALLLMLVFSVELGVLPASAVPVQEAPSLAERIRPLVLPVLTLGLLGAGGLARYMRAALKEALAQDYVRTARAKGLGRWGVVLKHALRNAMIPVATILALDMGALFSGALVTEIMFAYPGMGKLIYDAVLGNDFNLALVALLFATAVTLACNLAADLAYLALDPRISLGARS